MWVSVDSKLKFKVNYASNPLSCVMYSPAYKPVLHYVRIHDFLSLTLNNTV